MLYHASGDRTLIAAEAVKLRDGVCIEETFDPLIPPGPVYCPASINAPKRGLN
jgi:hypothetical protein